MADRTEILNDFMEALGAFVTAGMETLTPAAHQALARHLEAGAVDVRVAVKIDPFMAVVYAHPHAGESRAPVELFRVETEADSAPLH